MTTRCIPSVVHRFVLCYRRRSRSPWASEYNMFRTRFHFRHQTLHESIAKISVRKSMSIPGPSTGFSSDTPTPELRSRRHGPLAPTLSHKLPGSCHHVRSNGFPVVNPLGHRYYTGKKKKKRCCHYNGKGNRKARTTAQITSKVCACVTKLSLINASFLIDYTEPITTQTCRAWDTCKKGKGKSNHQK